MHEHSSTRAPLHSLHIESSPSSSSSPSTSPFTSRLLACSHIIRLNHTSQNFVSVESHSIGRTPSGPSRKRSRAGLTPQFNYGAMEKLGRILNIVHESIARSFAEFLPAGLLFKYNQWGRALSSKLISSLTAPAAFCRPRTRRSNSAQLNRTPE